MRKRALLLGAVLALLAMADTVRAQTATGQITGTVKDATGAVVPGSQRYRSQRADGLEAHGRHESERRLLRSRSCPPASTR